MLQLVQDVNIMFQLGGGRGHERTLSDGRVIPVRPYRKGKERKNPEIYGEKRYVFDDKKIDDDTSKNKS